MTAEGPASEPAPAASPRPLSGVKVLDLTNVLAGPYCSYQLMLLGAEVTKVEVPGRGDLARRLGPDPELNGRNLGASFLAQNGGKKSVEINLKQEYGRTEFERLVRESDVLLENFRPGVMTRLGYPWERLQEMNPRLVYCAISGFGQTGPMSQRPAYDQIIQGLSGMMSVTGTSDSGPLRVGFPACDTIGGLMAALSINAALLGRESTGRGSFLDVSMLEATLSAMGWTVSNYLVSGIEPTPMGDQNATAAPSGTFTAADGPLNVAANRQAQFEKLCELVGRPDLCDDPRFSEREARKLNRVALNEALNEALRARTAGEWEELLSGHGVPAARVLTVMQAVELEQLEHREFFTDLPLPDGSEREVRVVGSGVRIDGCAPHPEHAAPLLGDHSGRLGEAEAPEVDGHAHPTVTRSERPA